MHEPVKVNVEDYLAGSDTLPREFTAHLLACETCRQEVAELKTQSTLLRTLKTSEEVEPRVGFYARVVDRIDAQRQSSIWTIFLEPAFGRRLAVASAVLAVLMGFYLVSSEPAGRQIMAHRTNAPTVVLPGEDEPGPVLGAGPDQDRGAVLVNLATYREQ
jgi:predicted anti-sigma-YlaC factor YlaD